MHRRIHVGTREPLSRSGGTHRYIETLAMGQSLNGKAVTVLDRIRANGDYEVAQGGPLPAADELNAGDVLHMHFAWSARPFLRHHRAQFAAAVPLYHFHGPWAAEALAQGQGYVNAMGKWLYEQMVYRRQARIVCASRAFASRLSRLYGISRRRISAVTPGVDINRFQPGDKASAKEALGLPGDAFAFAAVRRLEPRMGLQSAIDAMRQIPSAHLAIAGTGSLKDSLQQHIEGAGLGDRVRLLGRVPDDQLHLVYQAADTTLVPSTSLEGFGMVVLESLACGTGVVASNVGGLPEAMGPFAAEWTYDPTRPGELVRKMRMAVATPLPSADAVAFARSRSAEVVAREIDDVVGL